MTTPSELPLSAKTQSPQSFLCTKALTLLLGEQAAYVYAVLVNHNRMTLTQIVKFSGLKPHVVKKVLVSLVQLNCAVYYKETNFVTSRTSVLYFPNEEGVHKLICAGDIISHVRRSYSELHAAIVQNILVSGHLAIDDYLSSFDKKSEIQDIEMAFFHLVTDKWLVPINETHFQNKFDVFLELFKRETQIFNTENRGKVVSQAKKLLVIKEETRRKFEQLMSSERLNSQLFASQSSDSFFRKVNPKIPLTLSFDRYSKRLRSLQLASEARHRVGEVSAKLYALILNRVETKSRSPQTAAAQLEKFMAGVGQSTVGLDPHANEELRKRLELRDQERGFNLTVNDVYKELSSNGEKFGVSENDLQGTIYDGSVEKKRRRVDESVGGTKKIKLEVTDTFDALKNDFEEDSEEEDVGGGARSTQPDSRILTLIMHHLKLLASDERLPLLIESGTGQFYVPFTKIQPLLARHAFKQYLRTIFGSESLKVLNCVEEKRLVDEKAISKVVLMKENAVRSILGRLLSFHVLEMQEIPKTQDRSAMRAVYAFRFKPNVAIPLFQDSLVFNMGEILERLEQLKQQNKILLDKISREDVRGKEHELLLTSELKQLQRFYDFEKLSLAKFARIGGAVEVFKYEGGV